MKTLHICANCETAEQKCNNKTYFIRLKYEAIKTPLIVALRKTEVENPLSLRVILTSKKQAIIMFKIKCKL